MFEEDLKAAIFGLDFLSSNEGWIGFCRVQRQVSWLLKFFLLDLESKINCILLVTFAAPYDCNAITFSTVFYFRLYTGDEKFTSAIVILN